MKRQAFHYFAALGVISPAADAPDAALTAAVAGIRRKVRGGLPQRRHRQPQEPSGGNQDQYGAEVSLEEEKS